METEEKYDVLMEQFLRAAAKYDPHYSDKVKEVVEVIENALSGSPFFGAVDVDRHLEFRCHAICACCAAVGFLRSQPAGKRNGRFRSRVDFRSETPATEQPLEIRYRKGSPLFRWNQAGPAALSPPAGDGSGPALKGQVRPNGCLCI